PPVLRVERLVERQLLLDVLDVLLRRGAAGDPLSGVPAGDDHEDQEDDEADGDQHEHHPDDAPDEEGEHQCSILTFARGSSASRRPSPKMFSASTVRTIAMPGTIASHGAVWMRSWPSEISVPHE